MQSATGSGGAGVATPALNDRQRRVAFATVLIAFVLEVADVTIVNTALPRIRDALGASEQAMQWIVAGYLLALGSLLLLGGRLGDAFGYRRMFLIGVAAFVATSALCGLARTPEQLVIARLLQGGAGAMMGPQVMAIVQILFSPLERVGRLAWFGVIGGLAAIIGPIVGGVLIEIDVLGLGWRSIFLINLPIGVIALWAGARTIPDVDRDAPLRIDLFGAVCFALGFALLLLSLIEGAESGWPAWTVFTLPGGAALILAGWRRAVAQRSAGRPAMIEPALFRLPTFRWGLVAVLAFSGASAGFLLIFAVALQQGLGRSPLETALIHIPFGLGVMAGISLIGRRYLPRFGRALLAGGATLMAIAATATLAMIASGYSGGPGLIAVIAAAGVGMGMLAGPLPPVVVADVDRAHAGTASATLRTAQQIGGAVGVAAIGAAYFAAAAPDVAAARLAGLYPGAAVMLVMLALAMIAALRLPADIFGIGTQRRD